MKHLFRTLTVAVCAAAILGSGAAPASAAPLPLEWRGSGLWHKDMRMEEELSSLGMNRADVKFTNVESYSDSDRLYVPGANARVVADTLPESERAAGTWHVDWLKYKALSDAGATGAGVKVAVIDTYLNPDAPELQGGDVEVKGTTCLDPSTDKPKVVVSSNPELSAHGTNVVAMLVGNGKAQDGGLGAVGIAPKSQVWFYGVGSVGELDAIHCKLQDPTVQPGDIDLAHDLRWTGTLQSNPRGLGDPTALAARAAIRDGADVISVSVLSGGIEWQQVVAEAQIAGVPIVSGTPNPDDGFKLIGGPWDTNGVIPVGAVDRNGDSIVDPRTDSPGPGSSTMAFAAPGQDLLGVGTPKGWGPSLIDGTSYAAPIVAGALAVGIGANPQASRFQVLQALMRTTDDGKLRKIEWFDNYFGSGYVNPSAMLKTDPRDFPDENPQFVSDLDDPRCTFEDGTPGSVDKEQIGGWACAWDLGGPYPPFVEKYREVLAGTAQVEDPMGNVVDSAYSGRTSSGSEDDSTSPFAPLLIGGVGAVVVVTSICLVFLLRRKSKAKPHDQRPGGA